MRSQQRDDGTQLLTVVGDPDLPVPTGPEQVENGARVGTFGGLNSQVDVGLFAVVPQHPETDDLDADTLGPAVSRDRQIPDVNGYTLWAGA